MPLSEFDLIRQWFSAIGPRRADVALAVGDDCALLRVPAGRELAISIDTLVEGVHFVAGTDPVALGHKALAVNLSDLAAMGAEPAWFTLALTLPRSDPAWIAAFSRGLAGLAESAGVQLVGGDTTRGPLAITIQVHGFVEPGRAIRRSGARPGDHIFVTGTLGDGALGLAVELGRYDAGPHRAALLERLHRPTPRLAAGCRLAPAVSGGIDISDGLLADLGHICTESGVGARILAERLPLSPALQAWTRTTGDWRPVLAGGDDYELCLTVPPERMAEFRILAQGVDCPVTEIGRIEEAPGIRCIGADGAPLAPIKPGFDHFAA